MQTNKNKNKKKKKKKKKNWFVFLPKKGRLGDTGH